MSVKSDCPCSFPARVSAERTPRSQAPTSHATPRTAAAAVRSCPALNRPACRRFSSSHTVFACSPASCRNSASISGHTSANGSTRVRHVCSAFVSEGVPPDRYVFTRRPLAHPGFCRAVTCDNPCFNNDMRIHRFVCNHATPLLMGQRKQTSDEARQPAVLIVVTRIASLH